LSPTIPGSVCRPPITFLLENIKVNVKIP